MSEMDICKNEIIESIENMQDGDRVVFEMYPSKNRLFKFLAKGTKVTLIKDNGETTEQLLEVFDNLTKEFAEKNCKPYDNIIYILH